MSARRAIAVTTLFGVVVAVAVMAKHCYARWRSGRRVCCRTNSVESTEAPQQENGMSTSTLTSETAVACSALA